MYGTSNTFLVHTDSMFSRYGTVSKLRVAICISDEIWVPITTTEIIDYWALGADWGCSNYPCVRNFVVQTNFARSCHLLLASTSTSKYCMCFVRYYLIV